MSISYLLFVNETDETNKHQPRDWLRNVKFMTDYRCQCCHQTWYTCHLSSPGSHPPVTLTGEIRQWLVCPLADQYDVFVDWEFFSMCTDLIRCAGRGHLTVDVLWKNFEIWMGQLKVKVKHAPSLTKCWARWARSCVDLVWIVLSCQATQAERPDSLTQSKPNMHTVLFDYAQHFWVTEAWITLTFNCPIQIPIFFSENIYRQMSRFCTPN